VSEIDRENKLANKVGRVLIGRFIYIYIYIYMFCSEPLLKF